VAQGIPVRSLSKGSHLVICDEWCPPGISSMLFTLYNNNIAIIIHTNLSFFADDSKVYTVIRTLEDSFQLLNNIQNWCQIWLLKLNLLKHNIMHVEIPSTTSEHTFYDTSTGQCVFLTDMRRTLESGFPVI